VSTIQKIDLNTELVVGSAKGWNTPGLQECPFPRPSRGDYTLKLSKTKIAWSCIAEVSKILAEMTSPLGSLRGQELDFASGLTGDHIQNENCVD